MRRIGGLAGVSGELVNRRVGTRQSEHTLEYDDFANRLAVRRHIVVVEGIVSII
jgi:hypothetical protein